MHLGLRANKFDTTKFLCFSVHAWRTGRREAAGFLEHGLPILEIREISFSTFFANSGPLGLTFLSFPQISASRLGLCEKLPAHIRPLEGSEHYQVLRACVWQNRDLPGSDPLTPNLLPAPLQCHTLPNFLGPRNQLAFLRLTPCHNTSKPSGTCCQQDSFAKLGFFASFAFASLNCALSS